MLKTDYVSKPIFIKNFWAAFTRVLGPRHVIQELKHCDFSPIGKPTGTIRVALMTFFNHHHHHHAPHPMPPSQNVSWTTSVPPKKCVLPRIQPFATIPPAHHLIHPRAQAEQTGEDGAAVRRKLKEEREISDPPPPHPSLCLCLLRPPPHPSLSRSALQIRRSRQPQRANRKLPRRASWSLPWPWRASPHGPAQASHCPRGHHHVLWPVCCAANL
jgi:hypothetical protein